MFGNGLLLLYNGRSWEKSGVNCAVMSLCACGPATRDQGPFGERHSQRLEVQEPCCFYNGARLLANFVKQICKL